MAPKNEKYRSKQALLCILVFVCIVVAFLSANAVVAVAAIMVACGVCFWAAEMEPDEPPEEHHH